MIVISFIKHVPEYFDLQQIIGRLTFEITSLIDEEGVSTKSILLLKKLGEFLFQRGKIDKAHRCFQRALSMERFLCGTKPNVNMLTSLYFLGMTSFCLAMNRESKFYFEWFVLLFGSLGGAATRRMAKESYLQLALLSNKTGYSAESQYYLEKGLEKTKGN
jgi:hypothetical protein